MAKGKVIFNEEHCKSCGLCIEACPKGIIVKSEEKPAPSKCMACGICVKVCPQEILEVVEVAD